MEDMDDDELFTKSDIEKMTKNAKKFNLTKYEIYEELPKYFKSYGKLDWD